MIFAWRRFLTETVTLQRHQDFMSTNGTGVSMRDWTTVSANVKANVQGFQGFRTADNPQTDAGYIAATRYECVLEPDLDIRPEDRIIRQDGELLLVKTVIRPRVSTPALVYTRATCIRAPVQQQT